MPPRSMPVGLLGCGRWGRHILRDLITLGCDVAVVSPSTEDRAHATAAHARVVVDTIAALPPVAGFVVATPASTHADVIEQILDAGVPIFCEKPLTTDRDQAAQLAARAGGRLFVMDKWRYHPGVERLAEIVRSQELGPVTGLRTLRVQPAPTVFDVDSVWTLAPHDLSIALEVFGHVPVPRAAVAEYDGDRLVGLIAMLGDTPWLVLEVSARRPVHRREVHLVCEAGTALLCDADGGSLRLTRRPRRAGADPVEEEQPLSSELPLLRELRAFVHHLDGGPPPRSSASEAAAIVDTLATLRELAGVGRRSEAEPR